MNATIIVTSFGILAFDEDDKLAEKALFPKNPQDAARTLIETASGKMTDDITRLVSLLRERGYDSFIFENASLAREAESKLGVKVEVAKPSKAGEKLRSSMERFAVEAGFVKSEDDFSLWMHSVAMEMAKQRVKGAVEKRDLLIAQAIQTLDDLDRTVNLFMAHVREWYGIHFPELDRLMDKHETYARLVLTLGSRENFTAEKLEGEEIPETKAEAIVKAAEKSMGADITDEDLAQIQALCQKVIDLYKLRQTFENYLDKAMEEVAPNTKAIVGSLLGARLIAVSGGLMNLAKRPASTIQVLGAEKALFRSLKTGTRPPKHGMIFQHTYLHDAKKWHRGKIARALSGKLAIAVRSDAFGGRFIGEELKADVERRIGEIREKYAEPPPIPERRPERERDMKWRKKRRGR